MVCSNKQLLCLLFHIFEHLRSLSELLRLRKTVDVRIKEHHILTICRVSGPLLCTAASSACRFITVVWELLSEVKRRLRLTQMIPLRFNLLCQGSLLDHFLCVDWLGRSSLPIEPSARHNRLVRSAQHLNYPYELRALDILTAAGCQLLQGGDAAA